MLNFELMVRETRRSQDDRTEVMRAQAQAWKDEAKSFDLLGRYESRLTRQLVLYRKELTALQTKEVRLPAAQVCCRRNALYGHAACSRRPPQHPPNPHITCPLPPNWLRLAKAVSSPSAPPAATTPRTQTASRASNP